MVEMGYEPMFGARPLKRVILKALQDPLAEEMLAGGYPAGSKVQVDFVDDKFDFKKGQRPGRLTPSCRLVGRTW